MSPYMSFLLQPFEEILKSYTTSAQSDQGLWIATISSLLKSLNHDESGECNEERDFECRV